MPVIRVICLTRCSPNCVATQLVSKEAEDPVSNKALIFIFLLSDLMTICAIINKDDHCSEDVFRL